MKKVQRVLGMLLVFFLVFSLGVMAADAHGPQGKGKGPKHDRKPVEDKFKDADEANWAREYIERMRAKNVINGYEDGTFRPNQPVNRVEAVVMAVRLMGLEEEALKIDTRKTLHFKDAQQIEKKFPWAKGYLLVALENGLFDAAEDKLQAERAASRVWVSSLLVRALGLQNEALKLMTDIPNFKDVKEIPAGSIGYVNVAVKYNIVDGYPDGTFKPNKPVTRAEMAALLDRTNDGILDKIGAYTVTGVVTNISFNHNSRNAYDGKMTIRTDGTNKLSTYDISSDLRVKFQNTYIEATEIFVNDVVKLVIKDGVVKEAAILDPDTIGKLGIVELDIRADFTNNRYEDYVYKNKLGNIDAQITMGNNNRQEVIKGNEAIRFMEKLITDLDITSASKKEDILKKVQDALFTNTDIEQLEQLHISIKFYNDEKIEIEWKPEYRLDRNIVELKIEAEFKEDRKVELTYNNERGNITAKIEIEDRDGKREIKGDEAEQFMEKLIADMKITSETSKQDVLEKVLDELFSSAERKALKEMEIKIKFSNGKMIEIEW